MKTLMIFVVALVMVCSSSPVCASGKVVYKFQNPNNGLPNPTPGSINPNNPNPNNPVQPSPSNLNNPNNPGAPPNIIPGQNYPTGPQGVSGFSGPSAPTGYRAPTGLPGNTGNAPGGLTGPTH